ncbi:RNA-binding transcriptional accessory protein [Psychrosphaera saromensis]|uniref:RNA-binding transcriptional accessory protein n=1 Tax=Psychrosphaera saromensis TaxID=716813 RepID=A0A2S7US50_9GAMM|nr:Tex family protein [Psychrosphaera saromensis]PQJ52578.1 RNA-binding transcriptional accessory protein [Psychrosphaera saromensis]GHB69587.1 RNA-binding transcriptional accessory protein [Psychrosphaera saromensis]GLQ13049.1 RNA-binding transcriptional accessory protein [Psychrosphaera saromensis]
MSVVSQTIPQLIAEEILARTEQVIAAITLLDEGSTVPFIARYRKEVTGGLDDTQLRNLETRLIYLRELEDRRQVILKSIKEQEKLTPELEKAILSADNKTRLEDLYLPYKPKRRTKGEIAKEQGLEPLADALYADANLDPEQQAQAFVTGDVADTKAALDGAKYILMERFSEDAELLTKVRRYLKQNAYLEAKVIAGKENEGAKFQDYFDHSELAIKTPSHRALAMLRGRNEGILQLVLNADPGQETPIRESQVENIIATHFGLNFNQKAGDKWMKSVVQWTWKIKVSMSMENELLSEIRENAEQEAIRVFAKNLNDLLMAAPAGAKATLAIDPGFRTGCKIAVVDHTGKFLDNATIYPHEPQNHWDKSMRTIELLARTHKVELIAIGNGTASRESDKLAAEVIKACPELKLSKVMVSEAGASIYSASEFASKEFPDLDVSIRGAVSIARRLQDPLAELVKIEPKSIGVGQYQHDVSQSSLSKSLDAVVEDCVNAVGVDLNMASIPLLSRVSGLNKTLANNIVKFRDENGSFKNRKDLKNVERLGPKAFEQCAGFLKIANGDNPLDSSSVHPEAYPVVTEIIKQSGVAVNDVISNSEFLSKINANDYTNDKFGLPTVEDIIKELDKPGRDPRPEFKTATFKDGVEALKDLKENMILEGVITNVTNFGAFVDVGVHQDGLVHISSMTDKFISDPSEIVKAGDIVKVKVMEVDIPRKRISLSMRMDEQASGKTGGAKPGAARPGQSRSVKGDQKPRSNNGSNNTNRSSNNSSNSLGGGAMGNAFADAFKNAKK